jgi:DNA invertase Pin-like site-specific DNA recombinase
MLIGYARISTTDQTLALQRDALTAAVATAFLPIPPQELVLTVQA